VRASNDVEDWILDDPMTFWNTKKTKYPEWEIKPEDFLSDDLDNYNDPHLRMLLSEAEALIPEKWRDEIFICGGFACHLAGITTEHGDIDFFCVTEEAFTALTPLIQDNGEVTDRCDKREFLDVTSKAYGQVVKFKYRGFTYDLVDLSERIGKIAGRKKNTIEHALMEFDINWSMAGIHLGERKLYVHPDALLETPRVNPTRAEIFLEGTRGRLTKYADRLRRQASMVGVADLIGITDKRIKMETKHRQKTSWY